MAGLPPPAVGSIGEKSIPLQPRSYLYVPGDAPAKLAKAPRVAGDALILDLEDAVAPDAKEAARAHVKAALALYGGTHPTWVRVNSTALEADIAAVATRGLAGLVVAKAELDVLVAADDLLTSAEKKLDLRPGSIPVIALLETARGVLTAAELATAPRVTRLAVGEADLIGELGLRPGSDRTELTSIRLQVVLASAAAGLAPPIGPVETRLNSEADLVRSTQALLALGFRARTAIHPKQVAVINEVFTPTPEEVAAASQAIQALGARGVAVDAAGNMTDAAVLRSAYEVLSRATQESV